MDFDYYQSLDWPKKLSRF